MGEFSILSYLIFIPLIGAGITFAIRGDEAVVARNSRYVALWTSVATFLLSLFLWSNFDQSTADFQFVEKHEWMPAFGISYHLGVDGISVLFVLLTTLLTPLCILASWTSIKDRVKEYMISFLILETMMIGMFCALDIFIFYIFFEAVLIPMFL
ncbi:MAG: NADH-quinone oxidoreductase subunit M, partial [Rhodospirillales bacterium]|nr:NADH-quinone oxidoreductase subunit M [Rhodospirillales bacterium]